MNIRIGTAGWSIPREFKEFFPEANSQLESYSKNFNCVEINSTFYKFHKPQTFAKWASQTSEDFEFSLKLHRSFTHDCGLKPRKVDIQNNLLQMAELGTKWKVLLLQFPSKQDFHEEKMKKFYEVLRNIYSGAIVLEPRNQTWISKESKILMKEFKISKVQADPERCPHDFKAILSSGGINYFRLHGSPSIYRSAYTDDYLNKLFDNLISIKKPWCIFDNTAIGKGTGNALTLRSNPY